MTRHRPAEATAPGPDDTASAPLAGPLPDPCSERYEAHTRLRSADGAGPPLDVFLSGTVFMDMIFTGLPGLPAPGTELYTKGLGSAPGGSANMAVAMSRLGMRVGLGAAFGDDMFGAYLWRTLSEQEGIDLSGSRQLQGWPTPVTVSLAYDQDRSMITYGEDLPGTVEELISVPASGSRTCFIDLGEDDAPAWARHLREGGATIFADVGWDGTGAWSPTVLDRLSAVDVFLPNAAEAMAYTRTTSPAAALEALAERVPVCVVKVGSQGAIGIDNTTGERASAAAIPVTALDPTGAGDVFGAAFVFGSLAGWSLEERMKFANLCAGLSVRHYSGSLGAPCWGEIAAWGEDPDVPEEVLAQYGFVVPYIPEAAVDDIARALPTVRG